MPNQNLNQIVEKIERGTVFYSVSSPHQIIYSKGRKVLRKPHYVLGDGEKLIAKGCRHCPTHWEWVLLLQHYKKQPWVKRFREECSGEIARTCIDSKRYIVHPVVDIVLERDDWILKGGNSRQIAVYLQSTESRFQWTPSAYQLIKQIQLAFDLYGWAGASGLKAEIFDRVGI